MSPLCLPQVVWSAVPRDRSTPAAVAYAIQRWPLAVMPEPGEGGYVRSLLAAEPRLDAVHDTYSIVDGGGGDASRPFYRVLALDAGGQVVAATSPSRPAISQGGQQKAGEEGTEQWQWAPALSATLTACKTYWKLVTLPSYTLLHDAGNLFVSSQPCGSGPCRRLLQVPTIQAAIDAAAPGTTVNVLPGAIESKPRCCRGSGTERRRAWPCLLQRARPTSAQATPT